MIVEYLRMLQAQAEDGTNGVNAVLASLTMDASDPRPPDVARFLNETDDDEAARGQPPADWPALMFLHQFPDEASHNTPDRRTDAPRLTAGGYYITNDPDPAEAVRDALNTLRALRISLSRIITDDAAKVRNGVQIVNIHEWRFEPVTMPLEESGGGRLGKRIEGALMVTAEVRDTET